MVFQSVFAHGDASYVQKQLEVSLEKACGLTSGRLRIRIFDAAVPGKTGIELTGIPPLDDAEAARVWRMLDEWNRAAGGSPLTYGAQC